MSQIVRAKAKTQAVLLQLAQIHAAQFQAALPYSSTTEVARVHATIAHAAQIQANPIQTARLHATALHLTNIHGTQSHAIIHHGNMPMAQIQAAHFKAALAQANQATIKQSQKALYRTRKSVFNRPKKRIDFPKNVITDGTKLVTEKGQIFHMMLSSIVSDPVLKEKIMKNNFDLSINISPDILREFLNKQSKMQTSNSLETSIKTVNFKNKLPLPVNSAIVENQQKILSGGNSKMRNIIKNAVYKSFEDLSPETKEAMEIRRKINLVNEIEEFGALKTLEENFGEDKDYIMSFNNVDEEIIDRELAVLRSKLSGLSI